MASEYKCDICGASATVHITKIIGGKKFKVHLCEACAQKASSESLNLPEDFSSNLKKLEAKFIERISKIGDGKTCKMCGADLEKIQKGGRFCCPDCYASMGDDRLFDIFSQIHGASRHNGKYPKHHICVEIPQISDADIPEELKEQLKEVVKDMPVLEQLAEAHIKIKSGKVVEKNTKAFAKSSEKSSPITEPEEESRESLMRKLNLAVAEERYEDAARFRDLLKSISPSSQK